MPKGCSSKWLFKTKIQNTACSWLLQEAAGQLLREVGSVSTLLLDQGGEHGQLPAEPRTGTFCTDTTPLLNPWCFHSLSPRTFQSFELLKWLNGLVYVVIKLDLLVFESILVNLRAAWLKKSNTGFCTVVNSFTTRSLPCQTQGLCNTDYWYFYLLHIFR